LKVLFVCTGNTCRSPMAEYIARKMIGERKLNGVEVSSAGLWALTGEPASGQAARVLEEMGLDAAGHRAALLSRADVEGADLILTMTGVHRAAVVEAFPGAAHKVFTLAEFAGEAGDVPDPIGQPVEAYRECARRLKELIEKALDKISNCGGAGGDKGATHSIFSR